MIITPFPSLRPPAAPEEGEVDGREYFFRTKEEFEQMIADEALIEHACYVGNYYGTPRAYVEEQLALGRDVILEIEIQGALQIKKRFPGYAAVIRIHAGCGDPEEPSDRPGNRKPGCGGEASFPSFRGGRGHREL